MKYKIKKGIIIEKTKNKINIFDPERSILYQFNESAYLIFKKLKSGWQEDKIIDWLTKKYREEEKVIKKDCIQLIKKLKKNKILNES